MSASEERAFEAVVLANSFTQPRGRAYVVEFFPASVVALYDAVVARPDWQNAQTLTERALAVAAALDEDSELDARYRADVEAGRLGFGAGEDEEIDRAIGEVSEALGGRVLHAGPPEEAMEAEAPAEAGVESPAAEMPDYAAEAEPPMAEMPEAPAEAGMVDEAVEAGPPDDGLLGGGATEEWSPETPSMVPPAADESTMEPPLIAGGDGAPGGATANGGGGSGGGGSGGEPAAETVQTWLNAEVQGDDDVLSVATEYVLAVFFGEKSEAAAGAAPTAIAFATGQSAVDVTVQLVSTDFTVPPFPQQLRVGRDGASKGRALFPVTPLHGGASTLSILVDVQGNFLQRLELSFDVGSSAGVETKSFGRPAGAAVAMEPRTASMQFMPATGGYELFVKGVTDQQVFVQLTQDELAARIGDVREALLKTVKDPTFALELDIPPDLGAAALKELAFAGFRLYQAIFAGPFASEELKRVGRWLRESLADDVATLQVVSRGFPVPWALMYLTDRFSNTALDWHDFIGMRHVVEQIPMREISAMPPVTTIASTPDLSVRVLFNDGIDAQMPSHPVAAQRAYWNARGVALGVGTKVDDLVTGALATGATDKVLYLYCHAVASDKDSDDSYLVLSGDERISLGQLAVYAPIEDQLPAHPLIVVNACESGDLSPNFYDGFVPYFLAKGARGVVGTECKTPGRFASEWAIAFFDRFFSGEPLGAAVLGIRREFLEKHGNPLGLLYGVHCDTDTRVDPALAASVSP
ncbi:CHAT domain-containing protein [Microbacterium sp. SS28]|uniref:CHAT domain-containing protein n=1 Tax=Microbacterium sp. SS28 TaxID=2919948 RepID=UPI001FAA410C|nr:CHAT domain-containing protein [Microbacterium sp. SS28]